MSFKKQFKEKLIKEDAWISLTNEQRESIINLGEQQLQLYLVSYRRELLENFADWMDENVNFDGIRQNEIDSYLDTKIL
jgi:hypothetical protein